MSRKSEVRHTAFGVRRTQYACRFKPDGATDPSTIYGHAVTSVTATTTGVWTIVFAHSVRRVVGIATSLGLIVSGRSANCNVLDVAIDNEGTSSPLTVVVTHYAGATATTIAADADNWISVIVEAEESSAGV